MKQQIKLKINDRITYKCFNDDFKVYSLCVGYIYFIDYDLNKIVVKCGFHKDIINFKEVLKCR